MEPLEPNRSVDVEDLLAIADRIDRTVELVRNGGASHRERDMVSSLGIVSAAIRRVVSENALLP